MGIGSYQIVNRIAAFGAVVTFAVVAARCGSSSPTAPGTPQPPVVQPPPPPPPTNAPPSIKSLTLSAPRVEADEEVQLVAIVEDVETPVEQLTYEWTATPVSGVFIGSGRQVRWRAPHLQPTPDVYTITLTVTEKYTLNDETKEHKVSASVQARYNDSYRDITKVVQDFLGDFSTYTVTPEQCVRNFSDNCRGKFEELEQIRLNRQLFQIVSGSFTISKIELDAGKTFANVTAPCQFQDIVKATGKRELVVGTCLLTAVYEDWKWLLCDSHFSGKTTTSTSNGTRFYMHP